MLINSSVVPYEKGITIKLFSSTRCFLDYPISFSCQHSSFFIGLST